jgi:16S rRNA (guanine527-N7)-methyltransferase
MEMVPDESLWQFLGWRPDEGQQARLQRLQELLREWNRRVNLTRLVEGDDYWISQVVDSLWPLADLLRRPPAGDAPPLRCIDVGTGGGFPGLALAIALPSAHLTLVDSVGRKLEAVRAMAQALELGGRVTVRQERIERTGRAPDCRGRFDWALARAVAAAPVVAEYLVPLLAPEGRALLYRGQWSEADRRGMARTAAVLNATVEATERRDLPGGRGIRHAVRLRPLGPCPAAYPRPVGVPQKLPIGAPG